MLYCVLQVFIIDSNCDIAFELVLGGHVDSSPPVPGMVALTTCLFFFFYFFSFYFGSEEGCKFITGPGRYMFRGYWDRGVVVNSGKQGMWAIFVLVIMSD